MSCGRGLTGALLNEEVEPDRRLSPVGIFVGYPLDLSLTSDISMFPVEASEYCVKLEYEMRAHLFKRAAERVERDRS